MSMKTSLTTVSPELANRWLKKNVSNRRVRKLHVERLAKDMSEGRWKLTGEPITFDENGNLQNGQHRLLAIIESGASLELLVVRGVPADSFDVIDQGSQRTAADALRAIGITHDPTRVAAVARQGLLYDTYPTEKWNTVSQQITKTQIIQYGEQWKDEIVMADALSHNWHFGNSRYSPITTGAFLIYRKHGETEKFRDFSKGIVTGADLAEGDPILALRNYIINGRQRRNTADRWEAQKMCYAIIKGWNYFLDDVSVEYLRVTASSLPMPEVH